MSTYSETPRSDEQVLEELSVRLDANEQTDLADLCSSYKGDEQRFKVLLCAALLYVQGMRDLRASSKLHD